MSVVPWQAHYEKGQAPDSLNVAPHSIQKYLDDAADQYGGSKAIIFQNLTMTYRQLRDKAEAFAASLREYGIENGDRVAIMLPNIPQTIIAFWGAMKAGATVVMTNPLYMEKELTHHFQDSSPKILITLDLFWSKIDPLWDRLGLQSCIITRISDALAFPLNWLQPFQARRSGNYPKIEFDGKRVIKWKSALNNRSRFSAEIGDPHNTIALLQYTGGTTGFSKGAMLTHHNIVSQVEQIISIIRGENSRSKHIFIGVMPFFHVFGLVGTLLLPTVFASPTIPVPRYVPRDLLEIIKKFRPTFFVGAPSIYISLMQQKNIKDYDLTCIQLCISGSSPFPVVSLRKFQEMTHANITEGFGLTEASPCVTANPLFGLQKDGSIGVPFPETYVQIVDLDSGTQIMGDNEIGELIAKGPQVMLGYWNHPEETAKTLRDGWLYTGDIAYRDEDGYYFIVDRKKDMAIIGGYNVFPSEIDEVLYEYPKIKEAVALSVPHRSKGETLKAYVVPKPGETITVAELVAFCRQKLASYKVPRMFEIREELPKTLVGKVLRRALREEEEKKIASGSQDDEHLDLPEDKKEPSDSVAVTAENAEAVKISEVSESAETPKNSGAAEVPNVSEAPEAAEKNARAEQPETAAEKK